ncbi:hypothetical protein F0562_002839 [Nyssa sinensis]|uniref:Chaperone DnaJ C-terminal domain-containing protein n=1 Tax=Nyssa sinensis TaxID=561372 RepID=A0A5J5BXR2_9ASTE|nr:hypothetical protein F0562_002839 [Nyssa sinensis]
MAEHSRSPSQELLNILGIGGLCKAYKSLVSKCHPDKNSSPNKNEAGDKVKSNHKAQNIDEASKRVKNKNQEEKIRNGKHENGDGMKGHDPTSPQGFLRHQSIDGYTTTIPSPLSRSVSPSPLSRSGSIFSRSASQRSQSPAPTTAAPNLLKSMSRRSSTEVAVPASLSRSATTTSKRSSTPIMYSNSTGPMKPPTMEKKLECTLEEMCFGCIKKIKITRDAITNTGLIVQEEETLTIKVKPGWTKGIKITFEGMGNETPGTYPADVTFVVSEKQHPLFRREGDDLELAIEIPLLKALTGCTLSIPLLGGENMSLTLDNIIYPGFEKIIAGQGMPQPKEQGKRGNLIIKFLVEFPTELTDEQRSDVFSILQDTP